MRHGPPGPRPRCLPAAIIRWDPQQPSWLQSPLRPGKRPFQGIGRIHVQVGRQEGMALQPQGSPCDCTEFRTKDGLVLRGGTLNNDPEIGGSRWGRHRSPLLALGQCTAAGTGHHGPVRQPGHRDRRVNGTAIRKQLQAVWYGVGRYQWREFASPTGQTEEGAVRMLDPNRQVRPFWELRGHRLQQRLLTFTNCL